MTTSPKIDTPISNGTTLVTMTYSLILTRGILDALKLQLPKWVDASLELGDIIRVTSTLTMGNGPKSITQELADESAPVETPSNTEGTTNG